METIKHFEVYIATQKATGIQFTVFGALLLISAILLHFSQLNPITQGLRNGFVVISILLMASGIGFIMNQNKLLETKMETYQSDQKAFEQQEVDKNAAGEQERAEYHFKPVNCSNTPDFSIDAFDQSATLEGRNIQCAYLPSRLIDLGVYFLYLRQKLFRITIKLINMNKTILITGASSGIGRATAKLFQEKGWNVIATMRTPRKETELTSLANVLVTKLDVLELETIDAALSEGIEKFGKIDVVLNNAGYGLMGTFESAKRESIIRQFGVNVQGLFDVTQAALPHFRKNKDGMFINISSIGGRMTFPLMPLYHSTKWAVEGFSESLRWEMAEIGVKVKLVEPGGVATDFGGRSMDMQHNPELTEYNDFVGTLMEAMQASMDPANMSKPEQIAEVIYTAATDGKGTLRYRAGADALQLLDARSKMTDDEFFAMQKQQLGM